MCDGQDLWDQQGFLGREEETEEEGPKEAEDPCDGVGAQRLEHASLSDAVAHGNADEHTVPQSLR